MSQEKLMIFIDGSNLFKQSQRYEREHGINAKVDLLKLRNKLSEGYNLIRAYFYGSIPVVDKEDFDLEDEEERKKLHELEKQINDQIRFYHWLMYEGFEVKFFPLRKRSKTIHCPSCEEDTDTEVFMEKGVDVSLVTDMLDQSANNSYDVVMLVAGDLDYREALERIKQKGTKVKIAFFRCYTTGELVRCVDEFIDIEDILDDVTK